MIRQLAHLCLHSRNTPAMLTFYRDHLGFPLVFTMPNREGTDFGWYFACGSGTFIEIFDEALVTRERNQQPCGDTPNRRVNHFCFEVQDLAEFRATLLAKGITVSDIKLGAEHTMQAWIADPDGNPIELMQYTNRSRQFRG